VSLAAFSLLASFWLAGWVLFLPTSSLLQWSFPCLNCPANDRERQFLPLFLFSRFDPEPLLSLNFPKRDGFSFVMAYYYDSLPMYLDGICPAAQQGTFSL